MSFYCKTYSLQTRGLNLGLPYFGIIEAQNGQGQRPPLETVESSPELKAGSARAGCQVLWVGAWTHSLQRILNFFLQSPTAGERVEMCLAVCWESGSCNNKSGRGGRKTYSGLALQQICYSLRQALPPAVLYRKAAAIYAFCLNCQDQTPIQGLCLHKVWGTLPDWSLLGEKTSLCVSPTYLNMLVISSAMLNLGNSAHIPERYLVNFWVRKASRLISM